MTETPSIFSSTNGFPVPEGRATRLFLIRHGETVGNGAAGDAPMVGTTDLPMTPAGTAQVAALADRLAREPRFDAIYASPLCRARETARALSARGLGEVDLCPGLMEIHCGKADGMTIGEVQRAFAELWAENLRQSSDDFRWPEGESYREFRDRCVNAVQRIAADHPAGRVCLVTHAGVISQIIGCLAGVAPGRWGAFRPRNASWTEVLWGGAQPALLAFDRCALPQSGA